MTNAQDFLRLLLSQDGDEYRFGAEASPSDADPDAFDCSELVEWGCRRLGVSFPDGSGNQLNYCKAKGTLIPVSEGLKTPGALLFHPGHVAVSQGNGKTIEARGAAYGVGQFDALKRTWTAAALVPGIVYGAAPKPEPKPISESLTDFLEVQSLEHVLAVHVFMEARGEPLQGQLAVAHVPFNRAEDSDRWPEEPKDVILDKGEFAWVWNKNLESKVREPWRFEPLAWVKCQEVARQVLKERQGQPTGFSPDEARVIVQAVASGNVQAIAGLVETARAMLETAGPANDPSAGATHYLNLAWCQRNNPAGPWKKWFDPAKVTVRIGNHTFLRL